MEENIRKKSRKNPIRRKQIIERKREEAREVIYETENNTFGGTLSLRSRFYILIGTAAFFIILITILGIIGFRQSFTTANVVIEQNLKPTQQLSQLRSLIYDSHIQVLNARINPIAYQVTLSADNLEHNKREIQQLFVGLMDSLAATGQERLLTDQLRNNIKRYQAGADYFIDSLRRVNMMKSVADSQAMKELLVQNRRLIDGVLTERELENVYLRVLLPTFAEINKEINELSRIRYESAAKRNDEALSDYYGRVTLIIIFSLVGLSIIIVFSFIIVNRISSSLRAIRNVIKLLGQGDLSRRRVQVTDDEFGELASGVNSMIVSLRKIAVFASEIGEGKFDSKFTPLGENDELGLAMLNMRDRLQQIAEEDKKRNWAIAGLAQFSEILRLSEDLQTLSDKIISSLTKYIEANQGAFFLLFEDDPNDVYLGMTSSYAYNKKKFIKREFRLGEGFVGQAALEKDTIYISDIPGDYVTMTSGLGEATPKSLLIVPLVYNDIVHGVVEFASFGRFKDYEIDFVRKLSETIGAALANLRSKEKTLRLLKESQQLSAELQLKQNALMENAAVMERTQKEMLRTQQELRGQLSALNNAAIVSETDLDGVIIFVNDKFAAVSKFLKEDLIGQTHSIIKSGFHSREMYHEMWSTISNGKVWQGEIKNRARDGVYYWVEATITPVLDANGLPVKYISVQFDVTYQKVQEEQIRAALEEAMAQEEELRQNAEEMEASTEELKRTSIELQGQINALNNSAIVSEADLQGRIITINEQFLRISKYSREELIGQNHRLLKSGHQSDDLFESLWRSITKGEVWKGEFKNRSKDGSHYWVTATITPVLDSDRKPVKYIGVTFDITAQKLQEEQIRAALEISQQQEQELRQNAEELQAAQEEMRKTQIELRGQIGALNNAGIVAESDLRGNIFLVNEEFCRISGYAREELLGQNHRILKSGHHPEEFFIELWNTIAHGKVWHGVFKNRKKSGEFYWLKSTITPVLGFDGKPVKYIGVSFDITAQILQEERISQALAISQKQEEELRNQAIEMMQTQIELRGQINAINNATIVVQTQLDGSIISVNDEFIAISGYSQQELIGQNLRLLKSDEHPAEFFASLWNTILNGHVWQAEIKNKAKDGSFYWVVTTITPVLDQEGNPLKFIGIQYEITQIKNQQKRLRESLAISREQEERLRESQEQLDSIFSNIQSVIFRRFPGNIWKLKLVSPFIAELTGYELEAYLKGEIDYGMLITESQREQVFEKINNAIQASETYIVEYQLVTKTGITKWVREQGRGVNDRNGVLIFIDGVIEDISDQKKLYQELQDTLLESQEKEELLALNALTLKNQQIELNARIDALNNTALVIETTLDGIITLVNNAVIDSWGYSQEELVGQPLAAFYSDKYEDIQAVIAAGAVWKGEIKQFTKSGKELWFALTITPVVNYSKSVTKYIYVYVDITDQKEQAFRINSFLEASQKQEEVLRNYSTQLENTQREMLRTQLELDARISALNNAAMVSESDLEGNILYVNSEAEAIWGYTAAELVGQNHRILNSGFHSASFFAEMWDKIKQGMAWFGEVKNKAKDGSEFWVKLSITPILDQNGSPIRFIGVSFDITPQKVQAIRIREELNRLEKQEVAFRQQIELLEKRATGEQVVIEKVVEVPVTVEKIVEKIVEISPAGANQSVPISAELIPTEILQNLPEWQTLNQLAAISETDRTGRITYVNNRFTELSGYSAAELIGQNHRIVKSGEMPIAIYFDMWATVGRGKVWTGELKNKRKDGSMYWVSLHVFPLFDAEGFLTRMVGIAFDITAEKIRIEKIGSYKPGERLLEDTNKQNEKMKQIEKELLALQLRIEQLQPLEARNLELQSKIDSMMSELEWYRNHKLNGTAVINSDLVSSNERNWLADYEI